jgi:hypothetical protein
LQHSDVNCKRWKNVEEVGEKELLLVGQLECLRMGLWERLPLDQMVLTATATGLGDS